MIPREHQLAGAEWALETIRSKGLAYLSWQERTGKTLTALLTVEMSKAQTCLIITKKKALDGWKETLKEWKHTKYFEVINYESVHKVKKSSYDFIILDEAHHAISRVGRPSTTWKKVAKLTVKKPILYLSATPYSEHLGLIYHQLKLSSWNPFKAYRNFYDWFRVYGKPHMTRTPYGLVETYTKYDDEAILKVLQPYFNFKTRKEVGIEHEPSVNLIKVVPHPETVSLVKNMIRDEVFEYEDIVIPLDSPMKTRTIHYQIEGGTVKIDDKRSIILKHQEKINYIKKNYEEKDIAIMAHFIKEREVLQKAFPKATVLSSDGHAEGVDLSHIGKLIVYSMSFKTSKHTQRLARQANHNRKTPIVVDVLVMDKPMIGYDVYNTVAIKKENFDKNAYDRIW